MLVWLALLLGLLYGKAQAEERHARRSTLIMYVTVSDPGNHDRDLNNRFFLSQALLPYKHYHFLFIINGCHSIVVSPALLALPNVEVLERSNTCFDSGGWEEGIRYMAAKNRTFQQYIFINSSVRGPFRPAYANNEQWDWVAAFTSKFSSKVKLIGTSINCFSGIQDQLHLQSMILAMDAEGYECCIKKVLSDPPCDATWDKLDVIKNREVRFTTSILEHGYSIASQMLAWHGIDVNRANSAAVAERCYEIASKHESIHNNDVYYNHLLAGEINLSPLVSTSLL
jgi:hypothetical protein